MGRHTYTEKEERFLYEKHKEHTNAELASIIGVGKDSMRSKLYSMGLTPKRISLYSDDGKLKRCSKCKEFLPLSHFSGHNTSKYRSQCKTCEGCSSPTGINRKYYTKEDNDFLLNFGHEYTYEELAIMFNAPVKNIRLKMYSLGVKGKTRQVYNEDKTQKKCSLCDKFFPIEEYQRTSSSGKVTKKSACRLCITEYSYMYKNKNKLNIPSQKPTFDVLINRSKLGYRICITCGNEITEDTALIKANKNSHLGYEIASSCKPCANKLCKERRLKRIAERGY